MTRDMLRKYELSFHKFVLQSRQYDVLNCI